MQTTITENFKSSAAELYPYIADFQKYASVHPYMKKVNVLEKISEQETRYEVFEEITMLGFIKTHPHYEVIVQELELNKKVQYRSFIQGKIRLTIDFELIETNKETKFIENVQVEGPYLFCVVFMAILKRAHLKVLAILKAKIEKQ
jgi:hypothetical protein